MSNLVLYRKYRPRRFAEIVGQEHIVQTLTNAIVGDMVAHAYMFAGPHGTGKTTLGRLLAKAVNCQQRKQGEFEPCNQCDSCLEINQGRAIDLIEIDAASNRGIDEIRSLKEGIGFFPVKSKYKVFIIDESHQLTADAANALLKTLEEPPPYAIFVLATTEAHKMMPTIVSRCQRFDFRRLRVPEIIGRLQTILKKEKINFEPDALNIIALASEGSIRDAETLLDTVGSFSGKQNTIKKELVETLLGLTDKSTIFKFLNYINQKKAKEAVELLNQIIFKGVDLGEFTKSLIFWLREILLLKIDPESANPLLLGLAEQEKRELQGLADRFSGRELQEMLQNFMEAGNKMRYASIPQLPLELAIVEICREEQ